MSRFLKKRPVQGLAAKLTPAQRAQLIAWLKEETNTYGKVAALLQKQYGIKISGSALGDFYHRHADEILGPKPVAAPLPAVGVCIVFKFIRPGEITFVAHPVQQAEADAAASGDALLRCDGVEGYAHQRADGSFSVAVFPIATPAP